MCLPFWSSCKLWISDSNLIPVTDDIFCVLNNGAAATSTGETPIGKITQTVYSDLAGFESNHSNTVNKFFSFFNLLLFSSRNWSFDHSDGTKSQRNSQSEETVKVTTIIVCDVEHVLSGSFSLDYIPTTCRQEDGIRSQSLPMLESFHKRTRGCLALIRVIGNSARFDRLCLGEKTQLRCAHILFHRYATLINGSQWECIEKPSFCRDNYNTADYTRNTIKGTVLSVGELEFDDDDDDDRILILLHLITSNRR